MANTYRKTEEFMKRTISICLFVLLIFVCAFTVTWLVRLPDTPILEYDTSESTMDAIPTEVSEEWEVAESMTLQQNARYVIGEADGYLVVYMADESTVYLETNIRLSHLDDAMQDAVKSHIYIRDDRELYDFLESYSS